MNHPSEPATPRPLDELRHEGAALLGSGPLAIVGGCGHVGLPLGLAFARKGYQVDLVDTSQERVAEVNAGHMPFHEDDAETLLAQLTRSGLIKATTDTRVLEDA